MEQLSDSEIQKYLGTYLEEFKLIKNVTYSQGEIKAELIPFLYPFTHVDSGHVNATQINLYLSQLTYILMAKCINDKEFEMLSKLINYEDYNNRMHARKIFFGKMTQNMKKVIYKKNLPIPASMKIISARKLSGSIFFEVDFELGKRACYGNILVSIQYAK